MNDVLIGMLIVISIVSLGILLDQLVPIETTRVSLNDVGRMHVTIRVTGVRRWNMRLWMMTKLFALAALVAPRNISVKVDIQ